MSQLGYVEKYDIHSKEQWLELRRPDITASDLASLFGVGYRSALAVWAEKTGQTQPRPDSPMLRFGRWAEPMIFAALRDKYPMLETRQANIYLRSPSRRVGATPDAISIMRKPFEDEDPHIRYLPGYLVVQGKLVYRDKFESEWCDDGRTIYGGLTAPLKFQMQVRLEAMLAEAYLGEPCTPVLAPLAYDIGWADVFLVPVERDPAAETLYLQMVDQFWADTDAGIRPASDPDQDGETLAKLYPGHGSVVDLSHDNELPALFDERERLGKEERAANKRRKAIKAIFQDRMGDNLYATLADRRQVSLLPVAEAYVEGYVRNEYRALRLAKKG